MNPTVLPIKLISQCSDLGNLQSKYVQTINGVVGISLTDVELDIVMILLQRHKGYLTSEARKDIKLLKKMSINNINNYIGRLRAKGIFVVNDQDAEFLNPVYTKPVNHEQELNITFKIKQ